MQPLGVEHLLFCLHLVSQKGASHAVIRHFQLVHDLNSGTWKAGRVSTDAVVLGFALAAIGIGMAVYLLLVH